MATRKRLYARLAGARTFAVALLAVIGMGAGSAAGASPAGPAWTMGPPAQWVRELALPDLTSDPKAEPVGGKVYRLVDHQVRAGDSVIEYNRLAWTAVSTEGVQNAPELQIDFDPSYQRLVIHHVRLLRNGRDVFSFKRGDVQIIQPEAGRDEQIYSGELTAVVFLRDLRPGDTLDYAYSLDGGTPILSAGYDDELWLQYSSPVERLRHVLTVPAGVALHLTARNTTIVPAIETAGRWRTYTWEARNVPAQVADEDEPGWFDPDPRVLVTTFASWADVARWATGVFDRQSVASPEIKQLAARWRDVPGGALAAAAEAARFVQDEVRYLGIEIGPSSFVPHRPAQVLRQRFGDCKDKSLLLVLLLRELGVDAAPALVDTTRGRGLDDEPASAFAFDHAIVEARIGSRTLWIDATESAKGGPIEEWDAPGYERALVLRPETDRLSVIERRDRPEAAVEVKETYTLASEGQPTRLDIVTTYRRDEADDMRRTLATTAQQDLAKDYLDDFAKQFAEIRALGAPTSKDDRTRNVITVAESYEVATFWKKGERELSGWHVRAHMPKPAASTRTTPLAVPYPVHVVQQLVVRAPRPFRLSGRRQSIAADAFAFASSLVVDGREMRLTFDYRSRADAVLPAQIKAHQQAIERVKDELTFVLTSDLRERGVEPREVPWVPIGAGLVLIAGGAAAALTWRARGRRNGHVGVTQG